MIAQHLKKAIILHTSGVHVDTELALKPPEARSASCKCKVETVGPDHSIPYMNPQGSPESPK